VIDLGAPFQAQGGTANFNCRTVTLSSMQLGTSGGEFSGTVIADGLITVLQNLNFYAGSLQGTSQAPTSCFAPPPLFLLRSQLLRCTGRGRTQVLGSVVFSTLTGKAIDAHTLQLSGPSSSWTSGPIAMSSGASLIVDPASALTITADGSITGSTLTGQVINYGTISQVAGALSGASIGTSVVNYGTSTHSLLALYATHTALFNLLTLFVSPGAVSVSANTLSINAVGTQVNGTFSAASSGTLNLIGSSVYFDPSTTISGSGAFQFPNIVDLGGRVALTGAGTIVVTGLTTVQSATRFVAGGAINVGIGGVSPTTGALTFADVATNNVPAIGAYQGLVVFSLSRSLLFGAAANISLLSPTRSCVQWRNQLRPVRPRSWLADGRCQRDLRIHGDGQHRGLSDCLADPDLEPGHRVLPPRRRSAYQQRHGCAHGNSVQQCLRLPLCLLRQGTSAPRLFVVGRAHADTQH
jgi:hypothetical protein